jgi:hypothetical protein
MKIELAVRSQFIAKRILVKTRGAKGCRSQRLDFHGKVFASRSIKKFSSLPPILLSMQHCEEREKQKKLLLAEPSGF